jgi:KipI family sensor histidine kinase inhibitor
MRIHPLGDAALLVELGAKPDAKTASDVARLARTLADSPFPGVVAVVPSYTTVVVHFDGGNEALAEQVEAWIRAAKDRPGRAAGRAPRTVAVPVCYGGKWGTDLAEVAASTGLPPAKVVALHKATVYDVRAVGFAPGFPYLGGLPGRLRVPRRETPRTRVPAGSVALGGAQTGIYPLESPGGWHLIGRTPLRLFRPEETPPVLLRCGDRVRFEEIDAERFARLAADEQAKAACVEGLLTGEAGSRTRGPATTVVKAGVLTTFQDLGRPAQQEYGVPPGGAMDRLSCRLANLLAGNAEAAVALECTLRGPVLRFSTEVVVAVAGARIRGVPWGRPFAVRAGEDLALESLEDGARAYVAVRGGFEIPTVLGSRSTYLKSGLPSWAGRALATGDTVPLGSRSPVRAPASGAWFVSSASFHRPGNTVRVVRGPQADRFGPEAWRTFRESAYRLTAESDRMGLRLAGPAIGRNDDKELVSQGVAAGTVQVPPDGLPIVLMADRQTIGGYPQIATVVTVDLPKLAQRRPGEEVRFELVTVAEARALAVARERELARLRVALGERWR